MAISAGDKLLTSMKEGVVRFETINDTILAVQALNNQVAGRFGRRLRSEGYQRLLDRLVPV